MNSVVRTFAETSNVVTRNSVVLTALLHPKTLRRNPAKRFYAHHHGALLIKFKSSGNSPFLNPGIIFNSYVLFSMENLPLSIKEQVMLVIQIHLTNAIA